jgi:hypothetical protein
MLEENEYFIYIIPYVNDELHFHIINDVVNYVITGIKIKTNKRKDTYG